MSSNFTNLVRNKSYHSFTFHRLSIDSLKEFDFIGSAGNSQKIDQWRHLLLSIYLSKDFYNDQMKFEVRVLLLSSFDFSEQKLAVLHLDIIID